jgi:uncharacterized protein YaaW (UPF0174 family)
MKFVNEPLLLDVLHDSWEKMAAVDTGGVVDVCSRSNLSDAVEKISEVLCVPEFIPEEISEAFDVVNVDTRRIRVGTDLTWMMPGG